MPTHVILFHHSNKHMFTETHKNTCKTNTDKCMWTCSTIPINPCKTHANTWKLVPLWPQFSWLQCLKNGFPESLLGWSMGSMHLYHIWYIGYCINHKNENAWFGTFNLMIWCCQEQQCLAYHWHPAKSILVSNLAKLRTSRELESEHTGISKVTFWKGQKSPADLNGAPQIEECCRGPAIEFLADFCTWTPLPPVPS